MAEIKVEYHEGAAPGAVQIVLGLAKAGAHVTAAASDSLAQGRARLNGEELPEWQAAARLAAALHWGSAAAEDTVRAHAELLAGPLDAALVRLNDELKANAPPAPAEPAEGAEKKKKEPAPVWGVAGKELTAADAVAFAALPWDPKAHGKAYPFVAKWFQAIRHHQDLKAAFAPKKTGVKSAPKMDLVQAEQVTTRFPPEPSGFMHIGHIKAAMLNDYFAHKNAGGKLIVRFDDTNPAKERPEFYASILSDLDTVNVKPDMVSYTSDHFDMLLQKAEQLIREGNGYVDNSPREDMKKGRMEGIESPCRSNSVERNLELWEEMKRGTELGMQCVLRGKIDMQHTNRVLRDPSLYRCIASPPHHRTGDKYKVYPLYDFCIPIVDSVEGVTHALRSSEYHDRNALYDWVADILHLRKPIIEDFARLNFAYVMLSKRKLQWFVDNKKVESWEDPRFPTVRGLLRRGLTVEAMRQFIVTAQGSSKSINLMDMDKLWVINKGILDPVVPRYTAIGVEGRATVKIAGAPATPEVREVPCHKKNASLGNKKVYFGDTVYIDGEDAKTIEAGEEVTLMDWGNVVVDKIDGANIEAHLHLEGSVKDTKKKLTWLCAAAPLAEVELVEYDHLLSAAKIPDGADWESFVRPVTKVVTKAVASPDLANMPSGKQMQLERRGYFISDGPNTFNMIPDGGSKPLLGQKIVLQWH